MKVDFYLYKTAGKYSTPVGKPQFLCSHYDIKNNDDLISFKTGLAFGAAIKFKRFIIVAKEMESGKILDFIKYCAN